MAIEWENGTLQLSPDGYNKYKLVFLDGFNLSNVQQMDNGNNLIERVTDDFYNVTGPGRPQGKPVKVDYREYMNPLTDDFGVNPQTMELIFARGPDFKLPAPLTAVQMRFARPNQTRFEVNDYAGQIIFTTSNKTIRWTVSAKEGAVTQARRSRVGRMFFNDMTHNIDWADKGADGGVIIGNDSDNVAAGGDDYISAEFPVPI